MTKTPEELTEEWNNKELPADWYYVKLEKGQIEIENNIIGGFLMGVDNPIIEILAPIPEYDEYKAMQDELAQHRHYCCCSENEALLLENNKLRDLLKECKNLVAHEFWQEAQFPDGQVVERQDLLSRINAAIGESDK